MHDSLVLLRLYAPVLFSCAIESRKKAANLEEKYEQRWRSMEQAIATSGRFSAPTCVFDLLWEASEDNEHAVALLKFTDKIVGGALSATDGDVRKRLKSLVMTMLLSFGEENSEYENHLAELAVIAKLIKNGDCLLLEVEKRLSNGRCLDFEVAKDGNVVLVEVYNIDFDIQKLNTAEDLQSFLEKRLIKKLQDKFNNIQELPSNVLLVPVLWGDILGLRKYLATFEYFKKTKIISPLMAVVKYRSLKTSELVYDFGTVEAVLSRAED